MAVFIIILLTKKITIDSPMVIIHLSQCFSNINVQMNHLGIVLRCTRSLRKPGWSLRFCNSQPPLQHQCCCPWSTLWVARSTLMMMFNLNTIIILLYIIIVQYNSQCSDALKSNQIRSPARANKRQALVSIVDTNIRDLILTMQGGLLSKKYSTDYRKL